MFDNSISNSELLEETIDPWTGTMPGQQGAQPVSRHTWMEQCRACKEPYEQRGAGDTTSLYRRHHPVRIWMFHISVNEMNNVNAMDTLQKIH
jgi:hypothetical protein